MTRRSFAETGPLLHRGLEQRGLALLDMRGEQKLEMRYVGTGEVDRVAVDEVGTSGLVDWVEPKQHFTREVPSITDPGEFHYYLDGSQMTLPAYFSQTAPIILTISSAGILERLAPGGARALPGLVTIDHAWLVPMRSEEDAIQQFIAEAVAHGHRVVDTLETVREDQVEGLLADFVSLEAKAYERSRKLRGENEERLLNRWMNEIAPHVPGRILVDGALRTQHDRTVGLVKSFSRTYLQPHQNAELYRLPKGHRSSAFRVRDKWRDITLKDEWTVWYLRLHDPAGRDPRHSLVRIEAPGSVTDPEEIDRISAWILAERIPRASNDARWPTLLYPIHFLERILKTYVDAETRTWPGGR